MQQTVEFSKDVRQSDKADVIPNTIWRMAETIICKDVYPGASKMQDMEV